MRADIDIPHDFIGCAYLTPCLSVTGGGAYAYQFSLNGRYLSPVGASELFDGFEKNTVPEIDTFKNPGGGELRLTVRPADSDRFQAAAQLASVSACTGDVTPTIPEAAPMVEVAALSQRDQPPELASRLCSPTCVAMVLNEDPAKVAKAAWHPLHDLYGVWPQNIYAASQLGVPGYLHHFSAFPDTLPVIASIAYDSGALTGAAMEKTPGHLVVIRGYEGGRILANDPAAPVAAVSRSYDAVEFAQSWSNRQGLGYVLFKP